VHVAVSSSLLYLSAVDSKETDLYWHDNSIIQDISRDGKALLFSEMISQSSFDFIADDPLFC
jgi:hypothetical protein